MTVERISLWGFCIRRGADARDDILKGKAGFCIVRLERMSVIGAVITVTTESGCFLDIRRLMLFVYMIVTILRNVRNILARTKRKRELAHADTRRHVTSAVLCLLMT